RSVDVALTQRNMAKAGLIDAAAGERKHRRTLVDADGSRRARGQKLEHPPGAGAEIEQIAERFFADHGEERRLHALLRSMQRADRVPIRGALGEISRRLPAPRLARDFEAGAVGVDGRIGRIEAAKEIARERAARFGQTEEGPGALALPRGETSFDQKLQVARDARLRLAQNGYKLAHRQFGRFQEAEDTQPRLLAGRLEAREERRKGERRAGSLVRHKHIFMSNRT